MTDFTTDDHRHMARALQLAQQGLYSTDPNPRVGCVLVKKGRVVGEGAHLRAGEPHAEVHALREAGDCASGSWAYVTLEPCSHQGRTPPCADALVEAGVTRVFVAMTDPNPQVAGRGLARLRGAGLTVSTGLMEAQARALNPGFIKRMECGRPWVRLKLAMSVDGRTAMASGESKWITGAEARADVQRWRARSSAIITGIGSVLLDDPEMTVRRADLFPEGAIRQPLRVVVDSHLRLPPSARILNPPGQVLVACAGTDPSRESILTECGVRQVCLPAEQGVDLDALLRHLAREHQANEVLVESGATLAGAFVAAGLVDELLVYMAPTLLGSRARPLLQLELEQMVQQQRLQLTDLRQLGDDLRLIYQPVKE